MRFNDLVQLLEAGGVDPMKFAYRGAPMGFRKSTGIENPEKYVPVKKGPGDKGAYIETDVHRLIKSALLVAASEPLAGIELKKALMRFAQPYHEYQAADRHSKRTYDIWEKLRAKDTPYAARLKAESEEYQKIAGKHKTEADAVTPEVLSSVQSILKQGALKFVNDLKDRESATFKSLEELEMNVEDEDQKRAIKFLNDIYRGKSEFEALQKFVEVEKMADKNPLPRLLTMYKTIVDTMVKNNLVGSPERTLNYITGVTNRTRTIAEPTKGRVAMKQKDPGLSIVANLIKKKKYQEAKDAVNKTKLDNDKKADLMMKIEALSKGEMTEADVIRPLYAL